MLNSTNLLPDSDFGPAYEGPLRSFDFTLLFEDSILTIVPASLFLVAACIRAVWLTRTPNKVRSSLSRQTKVAFLAAFLAVQITVLLLRATNTTLRNKASIPAVTVEVGASFALFLLSAFEHSRSVTPSTIIALYLLISLPFNVAQTRTFFLLRSPEAKGVANLLAFSTALKAAVLVSEAVEKRSILLDPYRQEPPEATSGLYNKAIFWWLNPLLRTGFSKYLESSDLYELDSALNSQTLEIRFRRAWSSNKNPSRYGLLASFAFSLKWDLLVSAIPRLVCAGAKFAQPFLIQRTIQYVTERDNQPASVGYGLIGAYALIYVLLTLFQAAYIHLANRISTQIRGGLVSLIFTKTLDLPITSLDESAALTLMSTDVAHVVESLAFLHDTWGALIEVAIALALLWRALGLACMAPAIVFFAACVGTAVIVRIIPRFQRYWVEAVQTRVSSTSDMLASMRSIKLLGLSSTTQDLIQKLRLDEIKAASRVRIIFIFRVLFQNLTPVFAPFATFLFYVIQSSRSGTKLSLATSFSILSILQLVERPLSTLVRGLPMLVSSLSSWERIQKFLSFSSRKDHRLRMTTFPDSRCRRNTTLSPQRQGSGIEMHDLTDRSIPPVHEKIVLRDCSFGWNAHEQSVVKDINLHVVAASFVMIIGPVGCGKSSLLKGILGETPSTSGFVYIQNERVAFADQETWVQNCTIRQAICGINPVGDERWYQEVVASCGLAEDIQNFPRGDATVVGSKGISLSGGQKARIALARAVYSREDILVMDDVFSGLDNDTEELIFRKLFGRQGPLRRNGTTIIMVTHAVRRLPYADHIISMDHDGRISEQGTYESLRKRDGYVHRLDVQFKTEAPAEQTVLTDQASAFSATIPPVDEDWAVTQKAKTKSGEWATYSHYFSSCGWLSTILSLVWGALYVGANKSPALLINYFTNAGHENGRSTTLFMTTFAVMSLLSFLALVACMCQSFLDMIPRSSRSLHLRLLQTVLGAPLSFFTKTDTGSTLNRFSQDMTLVDNDLPWDYLDLIIDLASTLIVAGLMAATASYFVAVFPFLLLELYIVQKYYLRTSTRMRILDLEAKAPLFAHFGETLNGLASIRAFGWTGEFREKNLRLLDESQKPFYLMFCIQRWLSIVLELTVAGLVVLLMIIVVVKRNSISPGLVGVGLLNAINLSVCLADLISDWTLVETSIGAIARLRDFVNTTECENKPQENLAAPLLWPGEGALEIKKLAASYSEDSGPVLQEVNLVIRAGEKVGICGRSGSGKSSLLASLLHLLEFGDGNIRIDGLNVGLLPREVLRQKLNVIPQEPWWITTQSVRFNMDPWCGANDDLCREEKDARMISALTRCHIWHIIRSKGGLDVVMTKDFISHGQRQLFCLARAILRNSMIVILDEVSASVDVHTDELMQRVIRAEFRDCTIIAVAHRLNTIVDFDKIAVLGAGRLIEYGDPRMLLQTPGSRFKELYEL